MKKKQPKIPTWAKYETVLGGVEKMKPVMDALKAELLAGQKAKREGKPKRVAYHANRTVNILFNLDLYFWSPMFQWAQSEAFWTEFNRKKKAEKKNA
jgi:hypothetical protein